MFVKSYLFFVFSALLIICSFCTVFSSNPVYSVLFLVACFCNTTFLLFLIEAEFLGLLFLVVYVGAIAVLFLFVIMILNLKEFTFSNPKPPFFSFSFFYFFFSFSFCSALFFKFFFVLDDITNSIVFSSSFFKNYYFGWVGNLDFVPDIAIFGNLLYSYFLFCFLVAGLILLVAILGAVSLTLSLSVHKGNRFKKQKVFEQLARQRKQAVFNITLVHD